MKYIKQIYEMYEDFHIGILVKSVITTPGRRSQRTRKAKKLWRSATKENENTGIS